MDFHTFRLAAGCVMLTLTSTAYSADLHFPTKDGEVIIPDSSLDHGPGTASTNLIIIKPKEKLASPTPEGETPASLACIYGLTTPVPGCKKDTATALPTGGTGRIALVDAFYNPDAESDLNTFSAEFGLPACTTANGCFHQVFAAGVQPPDGWWDEQALDIEMAHAMAPNAQIYLVEAASESTTHLDQAVDVAKDIVAVTGGVVSNSWGGHEHADETTRDSHFVKAGVVFTASSGDYGAPARYPSSSPNVVSCGGTQIIRDSQGNFTGEAAWSREPGTPSDQKGGSSGGPSLYESRPAFQNIVQKIVGTHRGTPDISFDADPRSGVAIYSTHAGGWIKDGGTSVSAPALAGIINSANHGSQSSQEELEYIYQNYPKKYHEYWHDILSGYNGQYNAMPGYDFVTGLGSPLGYSGK